MWGGSVSFLLVRTRPRSIEWEKLIINYRQQNVLAIPHYQQAAAEKESEKKRESERE